MPTEKRDTGLEYVILPKCPNILIEFPVKNTNRKLPMEKLGLTFSQNH